MNKLDELMKRIKPYVHYSHSSTVRRLISEHVSQKERKRSYKEESQRFATAKNRPWTEDELQILSEYYGKEPVLSVARRLGRTYDGVAGKARKLGL